MTDGRAVHGLPWDTNTQYIGLLRIASEHDERAHSVNSGENRFEIEGNVCTQL